MLLLLELDLNKPFKHRIENKGKQGMLLKGVFKRKQLQTCGDLHWRTSAYLEFTAVSLGMLQYVFFNEQQGGAQLGGCANVWVEYNLG